MRWEVTQKPSMEDDILTVVCQVRDEQCASWTAEITTEIYTLFPNQFPDYVPVKQNTDYNVSSDLLPCVFDAHHVTSLRVTFTMVLNENTLENVPHIYCAMSRIDESLAEKRCVSTRLNTTSVIGSTPPSPTEVTDGSMSVTNSASKTTTPSHDASTDRECNKCMNSSSFPCKFEKVSVLCSVLAFLITYFMYCWS